MLKPTHTQLTKLGADLTSFSVGYEMTTPEMPGMDQIYSMLLAVVEEPHQVDDIAKGLSGLAIALLSRFLYAWIDKKIQEMNDKKTQKRKSKQDAESQKENEK